MRDLEEIKNNSRLRNIKMGMDGLSADIHIGGWDGSVIFSWGAGWEHCSVSPYAKRIIPSWDDMTTLKSMFFKDDEAVIEIHPPKAEYVNNLANCLHLWRCTYREMTLQPSILVGIRKGQTQAEINKELREAYEMAGEKYE